MLRLPMRKSMPNSHHQHTHHESQQARREAEMTSCTLLHLAWASNVLLRNAVETVHQL